MTGVRHDGAGSGRAWPMALAAGLLIVVLVNVMFAIVAIGGADPVAESYESGER